MPRLFVVVGPSGSGKDTLINGALAVRDDIHVVRRVITRPRDGGHEDHTPCDAESFVRMQRDGAFGVTWRAHGLRYGIPTSEVERDRVVLLNGSRSALAEILGAYPQARVILVTAPDEIIAERLAGRGRESAEDIRARLERGRISLPQGTEAIVIENDATPEIGITRLLAALQPDNGQRATISKRPSGRSPNRQISMIT